MKNRTTVFIILTAIIGMVLFSACRENKQAEPEPFHLPKVPLVYKLGKEYLQPDSVETVVRVDSQAQRIRLEIRLLDKKAARLWRIDTMNFKYKNTYADWDNQKSGYYWLIQGLTFSSKTKRDKNGLELEMHDRLDENFLFHPVRQPAEGEQYPPINYKVMDEYWSSLRADAVWVANPSDGELFVMAHPIRTRLRGPDRYQKASHTDSVSVPYYYDRVDSGRLVCLRISVMAMND